jgi:uncharacterized protein (TIGR02996 family)
VSDRAGFLEAILSDPGDDTARAAYADWLREQPHPFDRAHGRFLAAGLALDRVRAPEEPNEGVFFEAIREQTGAAPAVLAVQLRHLLGWGEGEWTWDNDAGAPGRVVATLTPEVVPCETRLQRRARRRRLRNRSAVVWERGCVAEVCLPVEVWATRGEWVFRHCPLERVRLTEVPGLVLTFARGRPGWRMSGELTLPKVAGAAILPEVRLLESHPPECEGLPRERAAANLWAWTDALLTRLADGAGDRWAGPPDWPKPLPEDVFDGPA